MVLHLGIANMTKFPDFALDDKESATLAQATANLMAEFDMSVDPKIAAVMGLVSTAGTIYIPRYYLYQQHVAATKRKKAAEKSSQVPPELVGALDMPNFMPG